MATKKSPALKPVAEAVSSTPTATAPAASAQAAPAAPAKSVRRRAASSTTAKPKAPTPKAAPTTAKKAAAPAKKAVAAPAKKARSTAAEAPHKAPKEKLVRDSFTMPRSDFDLIDQLKERALSFKRPTKKSELLRAGLQVLASLSDATLATTLAGLAPLKAGRPKGNAK